MSPRNERRQYISSVTRGGRVLRDSRFDNARGVLIILVVVGHFLLPLYHTRFITGIIYAIYIFHMPCFIFISGYYAKSLYRDGHFRWGKAAEFLWLYFIYELIVNITEGLLNGYIPLIPDFFHESGAPWYLIVVAGYYFLVPVFHRLDSFRNKLLVVPALAIIISFLKYYLQFGDFLSLDRFISFMPFFAAGYFVSQAEVQRYLLWRGKRRIELIAGILILVIFLFTYDVWIRWHLIVYGADYGRFPDYMQSYLWLVSLLWYVIAATISLGFIGIMLARRMAVLTELGRRTLQVYFLHRPLRDILEYCGVLALVNPHSKLNVMIYILLTVMLTWLLSSPVIGYFFSGLRSALDPLLEKFGGL